MAIAPADDTKTGQDYYWLIPNSHEKIIRRILALESTGFDDKEKFRESLEHYYYESILKKAGVKVHHADKRTYDVGSIRAFNATEWVKKVEAYRLIGWKPEPLNPLQHETKR